MCVNFMDLNKAYPKDPFPIPKIDQLVDANFEHPRISFLEGNLQIALDLEYQEKTAFITSTGNYHYKVMLFGLKNARSTYHRMLTKMFKGQLGRNMEAYIDDMVVKSKTVEEHISNLAKTFKTLWKHLLKLNASKCTFGVNSRKFWGYLVTNQGIEVNSDQVIALQNLKPPKNPKEVQRHMGMTVAFNRFIFKSADKCRPFFQLLKKWKDS